MGGLEKDILYLIGRVRYVTETQVGKAFNNKKRSNKKSLKRTLRKMCSDYTLRKFPCNISYASYKDSSDVYYLNGSDITSDDTLIKMLLGSEIVIRLKGAGYEVARFYRNAKVGNKNYDIFIEYINPQKIRKQVLIEIDVEEKISFLKYVNLEAEINNSTIPFFMVPKVIYVSSHAENYINNNYSENVFFLDTSLNKLFNFL